MRITFEFSPDELRDILVEAVRHKLPEGTYVSRVRMPERNVIELSMCSTPSKTENKPYDDQSL